MEAEGIILAKSLNSNLLRACAIVHWSEKAFDDDVNFFVDGVI